MQPDSTTRTTVPPSGYRLLDDAFITPRILDESAFNAWTESLRALIQDADARSARLSSTATDTQKLATTIRDAAAHLQTRITRSEKLAGTLEQQTTRAESVIERLTGAIADDKDLESLARRIIEQRKTALQKLVAHNLDALTAPIEQAESRAAEAEARADRAERKAEQAEARLAALESRLDELTKSADRAADTAVREHERIEHATTTSISRVQSAAAVALDTAERDTEALHRRSSAAIEQCQTAADAAVSNALEAIEQLRCLAADLERTIAGKADDLRARAEPIEKLAERADALLGDQQAASSLDARVTRAEHTADRLESALPGVEAQLSRIKTARETLASSIEQAAVSLRQLELNRTELTAAIEQDIEAVASDLSPIEHAAAGLRKRIEEFEQRLGIIDTTLESPDAPAARELADRHKRNLDQLRASADEITTAALQRTEEAGMWLVALIQRAEQLANDPEA